MTIRVSRLDQVSTDPNHVPEVQHHLQAFDAVNQSDELIDTHRHVVLQCQLDALLAPSSYQVYELWDERVACLVVSCAGCQVERTTEHEAHQCRAKFPCQVARVIESMPLLGRSTMFESPRMPPCDHKLTFPCRESSRESLDGS